MSERTARRVGLGAIWRLAIVLAALALAILMAALGARPRHIYASTWTAEGSAASARSPDR